MTGDDSGGADVGGSPWSTDIHAQHRPWSASYPA
ncbi:peptidase [Burkholderia cenocepacia]|nr:peptidase [Burkholderia cenocepacia]